MANPFIVNPTTFNKATEFARCVDYVRTFLDENGLPHPTSITHQLPSLKRDTRRLYGAYNSKTKCVYVNLSRTRTPVKVPGWAWSYTGFKADLTGPGVLAHEVGHHVHGLFETRKNRSNMMQVLYSIYTSEPRLSKYEPNHSEMVAEAMRLFIMNPMLLKEGRPKRYEFITKSLGLKPPHEEDWKIILQHAHPKLISAGESWIRREKI